MLTIRLQRIGKKKQPIYRMIISEKARDTWGNNLEILGEVVTVGKNPYVKLQAEKITAWIAKGAQCSPTVHNILVREGIVTGKKRKSVFLSTTRKEKIAKEKASATA
jgi:small subunit ribosomal protein S16